MGVELSDDLIPGSPAFPGIELSDSLESQPRLCALLTGDKIVSSLGLDLGAFLADEPLSL